MARPTRRQLRRKAMADPFARPEDSNLTASGERRYELRYYKKVFPFRKLPPELRKKILRYALVHEDVINMTLVPQRRRRSPTHLKNRVVAILQNPFANLLFVNRQLWMEGAAIAYGENTFVFSDLMAFTNFFFDKHLISEYFKDIRFEIDQSVLAKPISGFLDVWCLLDHRYRNVVVDDHVRLFHLTMGRLARTHQFTAKITTMHSDTLSSRAYYSSLFALFFRQQNLANQQKKLAIEFSVSNPYYESVPDTDPIIFAPAKPMDKAVKRSLISTGLAVFCIIRLKDNLERIRRRISR